MNNISKSELRKKIRAEARNPDSEYRKNASSVIQSKVIESVEFLNSESVFIYVSTDSEPETGLIIRKALEAGKNVYVPKCTGKTEMKAVRIESTDELVSGYMGIKEPAHDGPTADRIDLSVIPCMAASSDGARLGHGAGFYDRFLSNTDTFKMCLCFGRNIYDDIPMSENDIKMDKVITESEGKHDRIINLPHHVSENRPHLSAEERAAQFSSFNALKGTDDEI